MMDVRRIILRASLTCLALTGLSAIALIFFPFTGLVGRFTLSGLVATIVAALCIPFAAWTARDESKWGGLVGVAFLCAQLLLTLVVLWGPVVVPGASGDALLETMLILLFVAPFAIVGARELGRRPLAGGTAVLTAALGLGLLLTDTWCFTGMFGWPNDPTGERIRIAGFVLLIGGGGIALGLAPPRLGWRRWPQLGAAAALLGTVAALALIVVRLDPASLSWTGAGPWLTWWRAATILIIVGYGVGFANVAMLPPLQGIGLAVQAGTALLAVVAAGLAGLLVALDGDDTIGASFAAACVALVSGGVATALLARFRKTPAMTVGADLVAAIELTCPRCRSREAQPLGDSACRRCGLRFRIAVEEPRCGHCAQLLTGLRSTVCPECGTPIATPVTGNLADAVG
jgi:hypothetical protein